MTLPSSAPVRPPARRRQIPGASALLLALLLAACGTTRPPLMGRVEDGRAVPIVTATPKPVTRGSGRGAVAAPARESTARSADAAVIYFGPDRYQVDDNYLPLLQTHAERLLADPELQLRIDAYTDDEGPREYNLELARMRGVMVQRQLQALGVPPRQLQVVAHGPGRPQAGVARNAAEQRRVELHYR